MEKHVYSTATWRSHPLHPQTPTEQPGDAADFIFFLDLMNFSFWTAPGTVPFTVQYAGQRYTGYWSLVAAMRRAFDVDKIAIWDPKNMASLDGAAWHRIFRSDTGTEISFMSERIRAIREAGRVLCEKFDGSFVNVIRQAGQSAKHLMSLVLEHFPTFRDESSYQGEKVYIYKRLQILVADVWACFDGRSLGTFDDIDELTMFADYRVPQTLVHLGLLEYSPELRAALERGEVMANGDPREVEIRAASIWAVERVRQVIAQTANGSKLNSIMLDFYLWDLAKSSAEEMKHVPIHLTRCVFY
ncbi:hypothetical protein BC828DRAFT_352044 [Blastocladiella britannica]|nr:hypothetical protein BC828DRAFT_352044 [Blastocladiella britannica]